MRATLNKNAVKANTQENPVAFMSLKLLPHQSADLVPNVALLIDCSGSMKGEKMQIAKRSAHEYIKGINTVDFISVVAFSSEIKKVVRGRGRPGETIEKRSEGFLKKATKALKSDEPRKTPQDERRTMMNEIEEISSGGGTDLFSALEVGLNEIRSVNLPPQKSISRIILLTDGKPTTGTTDSNEFIRFAQYLRDEGITIVSGGIGPKYNEDLLMQMAENSRAGKWRHLSGPKQISEFMQKEMNRTKSATMVKPSIQINPRTRFDVRGAYQYKPETREVEVQQPGGGNYQLQIGDLVAGEEQQFLFSLDLPHQPPGDYPLATIDISGESSIQINVRYSDDENEYKREDNPSVRNIFQLCKSKVLGKEGQVEGDETIAKKAEKLAETVIKDSKAPEHIKQEATHIKGATQIKKDESEEDTKLKKEALTTVKRSD